MKDKRVFKDLGVGDTIYYFYNHQNIKDIESMTYVVKRIEYKKDDDLISLSFVKSLDSYYGETIDLSLQDYELKSVLSVDNEFCLAVNSKNIKNKVIEKLKDSIKRQEKSIENCKNEIQRINEIIHKFKYYNENTSI